MNLLRDARRGSNDARTCTARRVRNPVSPLKDGKELAGGQDRRFRAGLVVYTFRMDVGPVRWDEYNRRHLTEDHPERAITTSGVEQAMNDPKRVEACVERHDGTYYGVIGRTAAGRLLYVAYVLRSDGRFPVHARRAGRKLARRYDVGD